MLKKLRIPIVDYINTGTGEKTSIVLRDYNPEIHKGHIQCHTTDCRAPMLYIKEALRSGANEKRTAHFKTKAHAIHTLGCQFDPQYTGSLSLSITDLVHINVNHILLDLNYSLSFDLDSAKNLAETNTDQLENVKAEEREKWIQTHFSYAVRGVHDTESLLSYLDELAEAKMMYPSSTTAAKFSYLNGAQDYGIFKPSKHIGNLDKVELMTSLISQMGKDNHGLRIWSPTPCLRKNMQISANARKSGTNTLLLQRSRDAFTSNGKTYDLYERLAFNGSDASQKAKEMVLSNKECFSFVAQPFTYVDATIETLNSTNHKKKSIFLNHAIGSPAQLAFT